MSWRLHGFAGLKASQYIPQAPLNAEHEKGQLDADAELNATMKKIGPAFKNREELETAVVSNALLLLIGMWKT